MWPNFLLEIQELWPQCRAIEKISTSLQMEKRHCYFDSLAPRGQLAQPDFHSVKALREMVLE